jgi:wyosine [tRNA(Phe)-imidazoG37] synthetase (radical SAM superfamily)
MSLLELKKYCWAWNRVYVKSNGRIPCWCDAGEPHTIVYKKFDEVDFIQDLVNSAEMREMRNQIIFDSQHYIKECGRCCCMMDEQRGKHHRFADRDAPGSGDQATKAAEILSRVSEQRDWELGSIAHISEIQLEPSFPCNLRCPGCLQGFHENPMSTEVAPYVFPYDWFERMLRSIITNKVKLDRIAFVGRGEPTLNKRYPDMIKFAKRTMPDLIMSMDTNSNQVFKHEYLLLNWINCSIDGSDQESYGHYRRGGQFSKAMEFLRSGAELKHRLGAECRIKWKYILFDVNDSDECLNRAQTIATTLGIDELDFIITHCGAHDGTVKPSSRFKTIESLNQYIESNRIFPVTKGSRAT